MLILTRRPQRAGELGHELFCYRAGELICTIGYVDASRMPGEVGLFCVHSLGCGKWFLSRGLDIVFAQEIRVHYLNTTNKFGNSKAVRLGITAPRDIEIVRDDARRRKL